MPKVYDNIKASYLKHGKTLKEAKRIAAMTYNKLKKAHKDWQSLQSFDKKKKATKKK